MNVASLELCKELLELSKWANSLKDLDNIWGIDSAGNSAIVTGQAYATAVVKIGIPVEVIPAYDLGYLLRKLQTVHITMEHGYNGMQWSFTYRNGTLSGYLFQDADTPEDACAQLAIELFKQGILKP